MTPRNFGSIVTRAREFPAAVCVFKSRPTVFLSSLLVMEIRRCVPSVLLTTESRHFSNAFSRFYTQFSQWCPIRHTPRLTLARRCRSPSAHREQFTGRHLLLAYLSVLWDRQRSEYRLKKVW